MDQHSSVAANATSNPGLDLTGPTQEPAADLKETFPSSKGQETRPDQHHDVAARTNTEEQSNVTPEQDYPKAKPSQIPDPNSKNQQKKLKRKLEWEEGREARKILRREKTKAAKQRKREAKQALASENDSEATNPGDGLGYGRSFTAPLSTGRKAEGQPHPVQVPITIIVDCQFDTYMTDPERISLGSQITRCYADNRKARYRAHLAVSSFGGHLKERFDGILAGVYKNWNGVKFRESDWIEVAEEADSWMRDPKRGGRVRGALVAQGGDPAQDDEDAKGEAGAEEAEPTADIRDAHQLQDPDSKPISEEQLVEPPTDAATINQPQGEIIYLTSDSSNTLTTLSPFSTYIIGGIVDKNRHKGICYKLASEAALKHPERRIKTAKLPIGDYLAMESRKVLTTNHVNEIMLRWLELGDWGAAFMAVIPKRKGGELRQAALTAGAESIPEGNEPEDAKRGADEENIDEE